jgi:hypothetical protein
MTQEQTLSAYRAVHAALDTECMDRNAVILSELLNELSRNYREATGKKIGEGLGWA